MPLDPQKIGKAISFYRKQAGLTQKGLADRLHISDKAVSKWERGISIPDVAYLGKLSGLLDTDIDVLLEGKCEVQDSAWKGLLFAEDCNSEISLLTVIYDKPLVYYLLSYFMLAGIRDVLIACSKEEKTQLQMLLGEGENLGIVLHYAEKGINTTISCIVESYSDFFRGSNVMTVFESVLLYGVSLTYLFHRAMINRKQHTIIAVPSVDLPDQKRVFFDYSKHVTKSSAINTMYGYYYLPILFSSADLLLRDLSPYTSNEDVVRVIGEKGPLVIEKGSRGVVMARITSSDDALEAGNLIRLLQKYSGNSVACLEEIAWRRGLVDVELLNRMGQKKQKTDYGKYILKLTSHESENNE